MYQSSHLTFYMSKEREEFVDEFLYVSKLLFKKTLSKELYLIGVH